MICSPLSIEPICIEKSWKTFLLNSTDVAITGGSPIPMDPTQQPRTFSLSTAVNKNIKQPNVSWHCAPLKPFLWAIGRFSWTDKEISQIFLSGRCLDNKQNIFWRTKLFLQVFVLRRLEKSWYEKVAPFLLKTNDLVA